MKQTKSNKLFTVCMTFKNECDEVGKTCKSIRDTAGYDVDIIVLNDCSDPTYDYEKDLKRYGVKYYESDERLGSSGGKELCVQLCETPYFILLDAHCRFYTPNWLEIATEIMERPESKNTIYCCCCQYFSNDYDHMSDKHMKAYGSYFDYNIKSIFSVKWNLYNFSEISNNEPFDIPSILGANYICSKEYWNYLGGYKGLMLYGREEPFISTKCLMAGGKVKCIPSIRTGHKCRNNDTQPYNCFTYEVMHNEMVIAYICTPELFDRLMRVWEKIYSFDPMAFMNAKNLFNSHKKELNKFRDEFNKIKVLSHKDVDQINSEFQKKVGFSYTAQKEMIRGTFTRVSDNSIVKIPIG